MNFLLFSIEYIAFSVPPHASFMQSPQDVVWEGRLLESGRVVAPRELVGLRDTFPTATNVLLGAQMGEKGLWSKDREFCTKV